MKPIIACHGDSLTEGYDLPHRERWSDLLAEDLDITVLNTGISGDTTAGMLARFHGMVATQNPTHVIITGGTNDAALQIPQRDIIANLLTMTRQARYFGIIPILGVPPPVVLTFDTVAESEIFLAPQAFFREITVLQKNVAQLAAEKDLPLIDFGFGMTAEFFLPDGVHPNTDGHRLMKENAARVLLRVLTAR